MIVAVSSKGDLYLTLTQSNSNKSMMGIFLERLVAKLDQQNPHWRNSHVLTWDGELNIDCVLKLFCLGAPYHKALGTMQLLKKLQIPIMMHGPYSYDVAPAELFFAAFKREDVNPNLVKLGKTHFEDVVKLVVKRCKEIKKEHLILNCHHCMLYVFRYLSFFEL